MPTATCSGTRHEARGCSCDSRALQACGRDCTVTLAVSLVSYVLMLNRTISLQPSACCVLDGTLRITTWFAPGLVRTWRRSVFVRSVGRFSQKASSSPLWPPGRHDVTTTLPITVVTSACCMLPGAQVPTAHEVRKAVAAVVEAQALHGSFGFQVMDLPGFSAMGGLAHSC